ncbi:unnamed protein product [Amoebophrya sp. A25]|nr:unnamed protein product [Amoebophrya sp. A25]|eukprot:GSA25T00015873001.1
MQPISIRSFSAVVCLLVCCGTTHAEDKFEWFRCDSCRATFHQIDKKVSDLTPSRRRNFKSYEFLELVEDVCEKFDKRTYGVKQYEGKYYLFGPGIIDHLGDDKGFGQMGMGDYDQRMQSYCHMFAEKVGEDKLMSMAGIGQHAEAASSKGIDVQELCNVECASSMSGASDPEEVTKKRKRDKGKKSRKKIEKQNKGESGNGDGGTPTVSTSTGTSKGHVKTSGTPSGSSGAGASGGRMQDDRRNNDKGTPSRASTTQHSKTPSSVGRGETQPRLEKNKEEKTAFRSALASSPATLALADMQGALKSMRVSDLQKLSSAITEELASRVRASADEL